jgi:hypothetical protein
MKSHRLRAPRPSTLFEAGQSDPTERDHARELLKAGGFVLTPVHSG